MTRTFAMLLWVGTVASAGCNQGGDPPACGSGGVCPGGNLLGRVMPAALTLVYEEDQQRQPTGLSFNPKRPGELWIVNYVDNSVMTVTDLGGPNQQAIRRKDPAAQHFMGKPTAISFADNDSWGVCGENENLGDLYTGPAVMSDDPAIFAIQTPGGLGSHLDMLHASPDCMGVAHEVDNVYWVFDGYHSAIVRYDFKMFHPPGGDDHSDGVIRFYAEGQVKRKPKVPSHLVFDPKDGWVYVADTGNQRIIKLDTRSGTIGADLPSKEPSIPVHMDNPVVVEVVPPGTLQAPTGVAIDGEGYLYVADSATGILYAYDAMGKAVRTLETGLTTVTDLTIGPDGKAYVLDQSASRVYRLDVP